MSSQILDENSIRSIVDEIVGRLGALGATQPATPKSNGCGCGCDTGSGKKNYGVFQCAESAAEAAQAAYLKLLQKGVAGRAKVIEIVKRMCEEKAEEWGRFEFEETRIGRVDHKIEKLKIVKLVPGVEWLSPRSMSGDHGITMEEYTPFGVVGAILPVTHSVPTLSGNIINIVAAGNAVVFNPHPGGARSAAMAVQAYNRAIERELGIENLVCTVENPTIESFDALCKAPQVRLLCITGGPGVVNAAMKSGKRAICAGPGNPPVLVDETADLDKAARDIIAGGAFDNNLLCIGEKEVFVVDAVYSRFIEAFKRAGAHQLNGAQLDALTQSAFTYKEDGGGCSHPVLNRDLVGADASKLAEIAGTNVSAETSMLFAETDADHPFVVEEQMMPMIPIVRVRDVEEGIQRSITAEHSYKHSAMIHSRSIENINAMAKAMDATLFVKNGPCVAGLGLGGEGYLSYSIATTTGEGITNPQTFTRTRRSVTVDQLQV